MKNEQSVRGVVSEMLPNGLFRVDLETKANVIAYVAGRMKLNRVRVLVGDKVDVVLDPHGGKATNRIVYRW